MNDPSVIERLLRTPATWAVVGCSPDAGRDSHRIASLLQELGHRIVPVNPDGGDEILGEGVFGSLEAAAAAQGADAPIEVVDIFRRRDQAGRHVDEAVAIGASAVWMQLGVTDDDAAARAEAAGLEVVMDRCPAIEQRRLRVHGSTARREGS